MVRRQRPYIKIDQSLGDHPRVTRLSPRGQLSAIGLDVLAIAWSDRLRTDGFIPREVVKTLTTGSTKAAVTELLRVGLWEEETAGYTIHDYLDWQDSAERIVERSEAARESAEYRWTDAERNAKRNANGNANRNAAEPSRTDILSSESKSYAKMPDCLSADLKLDGVKKSCAAHIFSTAEELYGLDWPMVAANKAALASFVCDGCFPDCTKSPQQAEECAIHVIGKMRRKHKGSWPKSKALLRTCLVNDREEARV